MDRMLYDLGQNMGDLAKLFLLTLVKQKVEEVEMNMFLAPGKEKSEKAYLSIHNTLNAAGIRKPENIQKIINTVVEEANRTGHFIHKEELKRMQEEQKAQMRKVDIIQGPPFGGMIK